MAKRNSLLAWARLFDRRLALLARGSVKAAARSVAEARKPMSRSRGAVTPKPGQWTSGIAIGPTGARRYRLFRPLGTKFGERLPLMVMLHG